MGQQQGLNNEDDKTPLSLDRWLEREHNIGKGSLKIQDIDEIVEPPPRRRISTPKRFALPKRFVLLYICAMVLMFWLGYATARIQSTSCPPQASSSNVNQIL
ncbi:MULTISPECIES: hypothetical protein [Leptolyngbya]|jgi:hypothetical protein|uniref:Uncharacterized protein n=1 Tax=Leptolyngbya boryana NIES-2135 TaxID=1973484 RepID=A0A1Z4JQ00_LEPBY|nr:MULTISPECIES: hypothetical protein [Leptolyngbya]BAY58806.1 hypothetical protein NIES2135_56800 [Leptolyngbya boryana NIES-2135]MBD2370453.1 hypothetical protein [Leptolyngbya sp. FACHB-161]MBD2376868.1 hypothetical protein [Leptolyngbya sp. FACHB-238]MBD2401235.1 hypothetical protein [Leptolyngbya sp. FACHB-239]MBD2407786.1 hypothetical protein [Leptolyngbya sp. FACHB-402]